MSPQHVPFSVFLQSFIQLLNWFQRTDWPELATWDKSDCFLCWWESIDWLWRDEDYLMPVQMLCCVVSGINNTHPVSSLSSHQTLERRARLYAAWLKLINNQHCPGHGASETLTDSQLWPSIPDAIQWWFTQSEAGWIFTDVLNIWRGFVCKSECVCGM